MKEATVKAFIAGLKEAGINFVVSLPCTGVKFIIPRIMDDPHFKHMAVANEGEGISVCAGAWLGGKKPAFLAENGGLILGAYHLMNNMHRFGGMPFLLVIDYRGDFGDGAAEWYFASGIQLTPMLESFHVPYTIVRESKKLKAELVRGQKTAEAYGKPVAVLISGEEIW